MLIKTGFKKKGIYRKNSVKNPDTGSHATKKKQNLGDIHRRKGTGREKGEKRTGRLNHASR